MQVSSAKESKSLTKDRGSLKIGEKCEIERRNLLISRTTDYRREKLCKKNPFLEREKSIQIDK